MATAIYHASGEVAVAYGESGPGSHNLLGGLGTAYANGLAVLVLTSSTPMRGMTMDADQARLFDGAVKWHARVDDPADAAALVHQALAEAVSGRPGPVHLEVAGGCARP